MKILILFLISFPSFANYATKEGILDCKNKSPYTIYSSKKKCLTFSGKPNCYKILLGFNCEIIKYDEIKKEWVTDIAKKAEYDDKVAQEGLLKSKKDSAQSFFKNLDCEALTNFKKQLCYINK